MIKVDKTDSAEGRNDGPCGNNRFKGPILDNVVDVCLDFFWWIKTGTRVGDTNATPFSNFSVTFQVHVHRPSPCRGSNNFFNSF